MNKHELYCDKVHMICRHVRTMFAVKRDNLYVERNEMTEEIVKDLSDRYEVNLNLLHKILFK
jgi:hypothetical protein